MSFRQRLSFIYSPRFLKVVSFILLLAWYGFFLVHKTDLIPSDLGRHLKNGELFFNSVLAGKLPSDLWYTNLYASDFINFPFTNHHWASGVVFFAIYQLSGFAGLTLFFTIVSLATLSIYFYLACREAGFKIAWPVAVFIVPMIAERVEVRPEGFSYLFAAIFFYFLWQYRNNRLKSTKILYIVLPILQILWINLHIYFFVGPLLLLIFFVEVWLCRAVDKDKVKKLFFTGLLLCVASLINPAGLAGFLYPLKIFNNYGLTVLENLSIAGLTSIDPHYANLFIFKLSFWIFIILYLTIYFFNRKFFKLPIFLICFIFGVLTWRISRNMALYSLFIIPGLSLGLGGILELIKINNKKTKQVTMVIVWLLVICFTFYLNYPRLKVIRGKFGLELFVRNADAASFIVNNDIDGPIFNDSDSGGYLIFYLYPRWRIFADNRPEAYPESFFKDTYIPSQARDAQWKLLAEEKKFNVIFYSFEDRAPWALPFIVKRLEDSEWAPVFANKYAIIFLKRNNQNEVLIKKYEIPKSAFLLEAE